VLRPKLPVRVLAGRWWHQNAPRFALLDCADPATVDARYQRHGQPGVWYASSRERCAWAELARHTTSPDLSPFQLRRRVGRVRVTGLRVLDLTDPGVRRGLSIEEDDLVGDDYVPCQRVADLARAGGLDGLLAPSAALTDHKTLAVFAHVLADGDKIVAEHSRVQAAPVSLLDLLPGIHPVGGQAAAVRALFDRLVRRGRDAVRRARR
jgi:RES domain-containing protein